MNIFVKRHTPFIVTAALLSTIVISPWAQASPPQNVGPSVGKCTPTSVSNQSSVLGYCNTSGVNQAWYATSSTSFTGLPPLQAGQSCVSDYLGINVMSGTCDQLLGTVLGKVPVTWSVASPASSPTKLLPLPLDTGATINGATQFGHVAGQSISLLGNTAVVWRLQDTGTPTQVSARNDNCQSADISDALSNGYPYVALNCPHLLTNSSAEVAIYDGTHFVLKPLRLPTGAQYCEVIAINNQNQAAGSCYYANNPIATFWSSFDGEPTTLISTDRLPTASAFLNEQGSIIVNATASASQTLPIFWVATSNITQQIPIPANFNTCKANDFSQAANTLIMTCAANDFNVPVTVFSWTPNGGLSSVEPAQGTTIYRARSVSVSGTVGAGYSKTNDTADPRAFFAPLP
ncbi:MULTISPECIES: hypothetical protein [unclassified Pseudomonas]|uniref:hypothetical protein n=1 Tax=unclassified Pseudomonas TaxID=196821 RepID=UPI002AC9DA33|nr:MULTISPECIES: hypothetical protein [unclassified Pseudomonas]MEB0045171.1 hypothetical protein [Pseudomonas sp. Dout3]MEB0096473.1 hypothetical protein [Pseudomonas sp. DC1.2]WPX61425.1 hypothetical protein RHM68_12555 [Pseudomonas sp. DC1.2]